MLRDILRIIGSACIIAGAVLFFTSNYGDATNDETENGQLKKEVQALQTKLTRTEEELAKLQTASSVAHEPAETQEDNIDDADNPTETIVKTILTIEPGMNSTTIAESLKSNGIIDSSGAFELYLAVNNLSGKIQIGQYELDSAMTLEDVAAIITKTK